MILALHTLWTAPEEEEEGEEEEHETVKTKKGPSPGGA